jgi:hypothetical protein
MATSSGIAITLLFLDIVCVLANKVSIDVICRRFYAKEMQEGWSGCME